MKHQEFEELVDYTFESLKKLRDTKGREYRNTSDDEVLANFKRGGERLGTPAINILSIYMMKHFDSIMNFVKDSNIHGIKGATEMLSEPIEGRVEDAINYLLLLQGLVKEELNKK